MSEAVAEVVTDESIESELRTGDAASWTVLEALARSAFEAVTGAWAGADPIPDIGPNVVSMPYVAYTDHVKELVEALYGVNAVVKGFDWPSWDGVRRYPDRESVLAASVADVARLATSVVRGERFSVGAMLASIENGVLPAIVSRLVEWRSSELAAAERRRRASAARLSTGPRSEIAKVQRFLDGRKNQQATMKTIAAEMGWDMDRARLVLGVAHDNPRVPLIIGQGGIVKYRGREVGTSIGLYLDVVEGLKGRWGEANLGLREIVAYESARGVSVTYGKWSRPDLVVTALPRRRAYAGEPPRIHAIEVEQANGFDIRSIYQAHAQGFGANYSWVFACYDGGKHPNEWSRIVSAADQLGVGLVTFTRSSSPNTWKLVSPAANRSPGDADKRDFICRALKKDALADFGLAVDDKP